MTLDKQDMRPVTSGQIWCSKSHSATIISNSRTRPKVLISSIKYPKMLVFQIVTYCPLSLPSRRSRCPRLDTTEMALSHYYLLWQASVRFFNPGRPLSWYFLTGSKYKIKFLKSILIVKIILILKCTWELSYQLAITPGP